MTDDHRYTIDELEAHGFAVRDLPAVQQAVLRDLAPEEFLLLVDIKARLDEAGPDVAAHSEIAGAALF
jgi:hypothetical protein